MLNKEMMKVDHPEDERFDEINIRIVERWKESELSGDEWRFHYVADIKRKGEIIITLSAARLSWMLQGLEWRILTSGEEDNFDNDAYMRTKDKCDQPGCADTPSVFYMRLKRYAKDGGTLESSEYYDKKEYRQFCDVHKNRGDCDMDDTDQNYREIKNPKGDI